MQEIYDQVKKHCTIEFVPEELYGWLVEDGKLSFTKEEKWEYVKKAIDRKIIYLEDQISEKSTTERLWELEKYKKMSLEGILRSEFKDEMYSLAKKIMVYDYMKKEKQTV